MLIRYTVTIEDLVSFSRYHFAQSPAAKDQIFRNLIFVVSFWVLLLFAALPPIGLPRVTSIAIGLAIGLIYGGVNSLGRGCLVARGVRKMYSEGATRGSVGEHELEVCETGLVHKTEVSETHQSWAGIDRIEETDSHLFIYLTPVTAFVVSKNAVKEGDLKALVLRTKERIVAFEDNVSSDGGGITRSST